MKRDRPYINASDAISCRHCPRRAWYDEFPPEERSAIEDKFETLIAEGGLVHEKRILGSFAIERYKSRST